MIELNVTNLSIGVLVGEFIIILVLMWHLGRESAAHERRARADERESIVKVVQSTRRGLNKSSEATELRDALVDKIRSRN